MDVVNMEDDMNDDMDDMDAVMDGYLNPLSSSPAWLPSSSLSSSGATNITSSCISPSCPNITKYVSTLGEQNQCADFGNP